MKEYLYVMTAINLLWSFAWSTEGKPNVALKMAYVALSVWGILLLTGKVS